MDFNKRNQGLDPFSFGPSDISPDRGIHGIAPSKVRSDLENDTDNQCKSASCIPRQSATPPAGRVYCYICGYPCFQNGGTIYDTFSVQCEHVIPLAPLSLSSGLADGTSTKEKKFSGIVAKVKQNIGVDKPITDDYDMWAGRIIGNPEYYQLIRAHKSSSVDGIEPEPEDTMAASSRKPSSNRMGVDISGRSDLYGRVAAGEFGITGEQFGGSAVGAAEAAAAAVVTIEEGGGIRGSAYQWAHPVCNMIKSNYPFIIICYTKYGFFFVSDNLKVLIPPGVDEPIDAQERAEILSQIPNNTGFECCMSPDEYYNKAISTHNLTWLLRTILGLTGDYASYSEQWLKGILLENAKIPGQPGQPPKGINWLNGGYKQLLTDDNTSGFSKYDGIFNQAFGIREGEDLKLKLLIDGNPQSSAGGSNYIPIDDWIERRVQQIKNNILIPILQNICSDGRDCPRPVYQISNLPIEAIPRVSLFSMISTTATGSKICHNMSRIKKSFFDLSKAGGKNKVNIIWSSVLFEDLLEVSANVVRTKGVALGLTFDKDLSNAIRKLAKTKDGLSKILRDSTGKVIDKIKAKKNQKRQKKGGAAGDMQRDEGLTMKVEGDTGIKLPKESGPSTPASQVVPLASAFAESEAMGGPPPKVNVVDTSMDLEVMEIDKIKNLFTEVVGYMGDKLLYYLESNEYPLFNEFLFDFIGLDQDIKPEEIPDFPTTFDESVVLDSLNEYGDQDPCLFSSLPESLCNKEGLDESFFSEIGESSDDFVYSDWWIYTEFIEKHREGEARKLDEMMELQKARAPKKKTKKKRKSKKRKSTKKSRRKNKRKTAKKKKKKKQSDLIDKIIDRLGY
jgi:hypothetical protein